MLHSKFQGKKTQLGNGGESRYRRTPKVERCFITSYFTLILMSTQQKRRARLPWALIARRVRTTP
jgi:hypothetical protein